MTCLEIEFILTKYDSLNAPRKVSGQGLLLASLHQVYLGSPACVSSKKAPFLF